MMSRAKPPEAGKFSRIFVLKVTLQSLHAVCKVTFECKLQNKMPRYPGDDRAMPL